MTIAEIMRLAAMAKFGWTMIDGKRRPNAPSVISGYGDDGKPLRDDGHAHAFWLPEDADGDGEIDHIVVYAPAGLDGDCRKTLDLVTKLWIEKRPRDDEDEAADSGRKEWRLALEGFGRPEDFAAANALFGSSKTWRSTTPYLMPWHAKKGFGWAEQIARELEERGLPSLGGASSRALLYPDQWSGEAADPLPPLPLAPRPAAAGHAWTLPGTDV